MVESYLDELVARLTAELGDELVGCWLFGSAALGGFDPARSDVDVQAVAATRLPPDARRRLVARVSHDALPCPVRGLELVLYAREDLGDAAFQINLNTGPRMPFQVSYDPAEVPRFWFVLDLAVGREHGRALAGPPPRDVFPPPARARIVAAQREAVAFFRAAGLPAQAVLAACRAWAWRETGRWSPKGEAARWALERSRHPSVIAAALEAAAPPDAGVRAVVEEAGLA